MSAHTPKEQYEGRAAMCAFQLGMLRQAIADTAGRSSTPNQKRLAVLSSLRIVAHQFARAHSFRYAWWTHALCRELASEPQVRPVLSRLLREVESRPPTPASNTGVKGRGSEEKGEGQHNAELMQALLAGSGLGDSDQ